MIGSRENLTFAHRRQKVGAACALLILALLQISIASHEFAHTVDQLSTTCETCIQQDRLDDFMIADIALRQAVGYCESFPISSETTAFSRPLAAFSARGPPPA